VPPYAPWRQLMSGPGPTVLVVGPLAGGIWAAVQTLPEPRRPSLWILSELPIQQKEIPAQFCADVKRSGHLVVVEEHVAQGSAGAGLVHALLREGITPRRFTHRFARGYPSGYCGSQLFHRQESGLDSASILGLLTP